MPSSPRSSTPGIERHERSSRLKRTLLLPRAYRQLFAHRHKLIEKFAISQRKVKRRAANKRARIARRVNR
jgi:hypothetical protein